MMRLTLLFVVTAIVLTSNFVSAENWSRFRGDNGVGISDQKGIPTSWSDGNYKWNIELPGVGHAAPIVWGDNLFVTPRRIMDLSVGCFVLIRRRGRKSGLAKSP